MYRINSYQLHDNDIDVFRSIIEDLDKIINLSKKIRKEPHSVDDLGVSIRSYANAVINRLEYTLPFNLRGK